MTAKLVDNDGQVLATVDVETEAIYQPTDAGRSAAVDLSALRSEERRVGKECRL